MNQIIRELKRQSAGDKLAPEQLKALILRSPLNFALGELIFRRYRQFGFLLEGSAFGCAVN
jgi:hypothetical protein